jgi:hypothetical protein
VSKRAALAGTFVATFDAGCCLLAPICMASIDEERFNRRVKSRFAFGPQLIIVAARCIEVRGDVGESPSCAPSILLRLMDKLVEFGRERGATVRVSAHELKGSDMRRTFPRAPVDVSGS